MSRNEGNTNKKNFFLFKGLKPLNLSEIKKDNTKQFIFRNEKSQQKINLPLLSDPRKVSFNNNSNNSTIVKNDHTKELVGSKSCNKKFNKKDLEPLNLDSFYDKKSKFYKSNGERYDNNNFSSKNNTIKMKENLGYKTTYSNPFEIEEEDKIFNELRKFNKKSIQKHKKIIIKKCKMKNIKYELNKVYKKIPKITTELTNLKKLKNSMNLKFYQNQLIKVGGKILDRECQKRLKFKFSKIRELTDKKYDFFGDSIDNIESEEKKIILNINTQQNFYRKLLKKDKDYMIPDKIEDFPNLKFYKTKKFNITTK